MRLLSSWEQYLATTDGTGIRVHQYADGRAACRRRQADRSACGSTPTTRGAARWRSRSSRRPSTPWTLSLRVPGWCGSASVEVAGAGREAVPADARTVERTRPWTAGDRVVLSLDMPPRVTLPHPRVDAVRGCVALERGPLVYCVETADVPAGIELEDVRVDADVRPAETVRDDLPGSPVGLAVAARAAGTGAAIEIGAIPYFSWAHRPVEAMRIWIPVASPADTGG